jgi:hypothetical protein
MCSSWVTLAPLAAAAVDPLIHSSKPAPHCPPGSSSSPHVDRCRCESGRIAPIQQRRSEPGCTPVESSDAYS